MEESQYTPEQEREGLKSILRAIDEEDLKKYRKERTVYTILWIVCGVVLALRLSVDAALFIIILVCCYVELIRIDDRISLLRRRTKSKIRNPKSND